MLYCLWANTQLPGGSESKETGAQSKQRHRGPLLSYIPPPNPPCINLITPLDPKPPSTEQSHFPNSVLAPNAHLGFMRTGVEPGSVLWSRSQIHKTKRSISRLMDTHHDERCSGWTGISFALIHTWRVWMCFYWMNLFGLSDSSELNGFQRLKKLLGCLPDLWESHFLWRKPFSVSETSRPVWLALLPLYLLRFLPFMPRNFMFWTVCPLCWTICNVIVEECLKSNSTQILTFSASTSF